MAFYTFRKVNDGQAFEVDRRVVLAFRNIGVGHHQGLVKFCCVLKLLPPMNETFFQDQVKAARKATQAIADKSMSNGF